MATIVTLITPIEPRRIKTGNSPVIRYAKRLRPWLNRLVVRYSLVGDERVTNPTVFPWLRDITQMVPDIRRELDQILHQGEAIPPFRDFAPGHERIVEANDWRSFFFYGYGYPVEPNLDRCPRTAEAVKRVPGLISAIYSVIAPGAHIKRHKGVNKSIMTAHIALKVPRDAERCRMDVDGVPVVWHEGQAVVIDDTYPHEVWNDSDETRVVLLIQFRRPLRWPGTWLASLIIGFVRHSSFVQKARRNLAYWESAFSAAEANIAVPAKNLARTPGESGDSAFSTRAIGVPRLANCDGDTVRQSHSPTPTLSPGATR